MTAELLIPRVHPQVVTEFDHLRRAADAAVRHPAGRLWCPWPVDRGVELRMENARRLPVCEPGTATARIVAGAALLNMRLTVAGSGRRPMTTLLPDPGLPRALAVLRRGRPADPTPAERQLSDLVHRTADGCPEIIPCDVPDGVRHLLRRATESEGVWMRSIVGTGRAQLVDLVPSVAALGSILLVVIGSNHDVPVEQLRAGQGLQRVVLTAAALGFAARVVAWPLDLHVAGRLPRAVAGPRLSPQVVLAVGRPPRRE